jgi:hypothetical protein
VLRCGRKWDEESASAANKSTKNGDWRAYNLRCSREGIRWRHSFNWIELIDGESHPSPRTSFLRGGKELFKKSENCVLEISDNGSKSVSRDDNER